MKKLFTILSIVFLVLAITSGVYFYYEWDSAKNEPVQKQSIDAGEEPRPPAFPAALIADPRNLPYQEYLDYEYIQAQEDKFEAEKSAYNAAMETYNMNKAQLAQQAEADYQEALRQRDDEAATKRTLMIVSVSVFVILAIACLLITIFLGRKEGASTVPQTPFNPPTEGSWK